MPKVATLRRFEYVGGGSDKFWAVEVNDATVVVQFGRNGTTGQTKAKLLANAAAAQEHADKLIQEKTGKGYTEVRPGR